MAPLTSLYLCNRTVCAAVGSSVRGGASIPVLCRAELPEGCLINGVITDGAALTGALKDFFARNALPARRVALVAGGTQFLHKVLTLPDLPDRQLRSIVTRELGPAEGQTLDDWMLLDRNAGTRSRTLLATRVDRAVVDSCVALAESAGLTLCCIDTALACLIKLAGAIPALAGKTFILLAFDGDNLSAVLFAEGRYSYSARSRLFSARGTPEAAAEIIRRLSGIQQFHRTAPNPRRITDVYFAGCTAGEAEACRPGAEALGLAAAMLPDTPGIRLPEGCALSDAAFVAGNLIGR